MSKDINKVLFIGSKKLGLICLKAINELYPEKLIGVLTIDDGNDTRGIYNDFVQYCAEKSIALYSAINKKHSEDIILRLKPDFCIVVGWYWLISLDTVQSVPEGFVGIHNSILPKFRGGAPLVWSIIQGEKEVGYTLFSITGGMDDGNIWGIYRKILEPEDDINSVLKDFENSVSGFLGVVYPKIIRKEIIPFPQNEDEASFCALRNEQDGLIDWSKSANDIYNFIRAQTKPYPGAYTFYKGQKIIIWNTALIPGKILGTPGQVYKRTSQTVQIVCGDHQVIELLSVQFEGEQVPAGKVIKSIQDRLDDYRVRLDQIIDYLNNKNNKGITHK